MRRGAARALTFKRSVGVELEVFTMDRLFRLSGADVRDPRIDVWLTEQADELHSIAQRWFARMRECGGDVRELMHDGCPVACVEDAAFGYVNVFKAHVNLGFFSGAALQDPARLLEGSGKHMRHVKLRPGYEIDSTALNGLIDAAYSNVKAQLKKV